MKKLILIFIGFLLHLSLFSQTYISGFINATTTWNMAGSPYIVTGNALLSSGYTLTIDPGVVIKFDPQKALQIDGELIAIGTPTSRITFTSNQAIPAPGDWAKIHFPDTCTDANWDSLGNYISGSIMKYCDVLYGGDLNYGSIHIESSRPYFSDCKIRYSASAGIYSNQSAYIIKYSKISDCNDYGLNFNQTNLNNKDIVIENDSIMNNLNGGMRFYQIGGSNGYIKIKNNYLFGNTTNGAIDFINTSNNIIIMYNVFESNINLSDGIISGQGITNDTIACNSFINNESRSGVLFFVSSSYIDGFIFNNVFDGNFCTPSNLTSVSAINLGMTYTNSPMYIYNNVFKNNSAGTGTCIKISPTFNNGQILFVYDNSFYNNLSEKIFRIDGITTSNSNIIFLFMERNNFKNPGCQYEFYNNIPYGSPNVYMPNNYWGSTSHAHIDSVIYDYFDFANQSVVYYTPISPTVFTVDSSCTFVLPTGVEYLQEEIAISLFPIPASNELRILTNGIVALESIVFYDLVGRKVYENKIKNSVTSELVLNVENLNNGIYVCSISNGKGTFSKKFIISR